MKILMAALAVAFLLATSAVAEAAQTRASRVEPNNSVIQHNDYLCASHHARTDPDPRIRFELRRDCHHHLGHGDSD
jgi:hypothetical protein